MRHDYQPGLDQPDPGSSEDQQVRRWYITNYRQANGRSGSAYALARDINNRWTVQCVFADGTTAQLGLWDDFESGLKVQDYCVQRDTVVKLALIELYENANEEPLIKLLNDALTFGQLPRRRVRLTMEVDIEMRGTDDEIKAYAIFHCRGGSGVRAARVIDFDGPRIEEPRMRELT